MAKWYAKQHLKTDPGIDSIYYLPSNSGDREIRLVEINKEIVDRSDESLEPIDFGIDTGTDNAHKLFVLDITPEQWTRIKAGQLGLPSDWSLVRAVPFQQ